MGSMWFNQYDPRWSRKAYAGRTMAASGCGPTAIANIVSSKHSGVTPADIADWLTSHGYASNGNGTYWSGIKAALDAYGCPAIQHSSMQPFFDEMAKGNRWGVILFRAGTRGGITWTGAEGMTVGTPTKITCEGLYLLSGLALWMEVQLLYPHLIQILRLHQVTVYLPSIKLNPL